MSSTLFYLCLSDTNNNSFITNSVEYLLNYKVEFVYESISFFAVFVLLSRATLPLREPGAGTSHEFPETRNNQKNSSNGRSKVPGEGMACFFSNSRVYWLKAQLIISD